MKKQKTYLCNIMSQDDLMIAYVDALEVLDKIGVAIESEKIRDLLLSYGCKLSSPDIRKYPIIHIPVETIEKATAMKILPRSIYMYDRFGVLSSDLSSGNVNFNPGSCGNNYFDYDSNCIRRGTSYDLETLVKVADALPNINMQSTAIVPNNIIPEMQDIARLKIVLENSTKPVVTGTFKNHFYQMKDMLVAIRGNVNDLKKKPLAIFDCCPSPTLIWSKIRGEDIINCGEYKIPVEFISMPQPGLNTPCSLYDALVVHTAETLSGIVISQLANPGAPVIYGGSPTMIANAPLLGNVGTLKLDLAYVKLAKKFFNIPCQAYLGLSDSKSIDIQAGYEKAVSISYAVLAGINNISGPGMIESENCLSAEMLVIDDEIIGSALNLRNNLKWKSNSLNRISRVINEGINYDDVNALRKSNEFYFGNIADNLTLNQYNKSGGMNMLKKAHARVKEIIKHHHVPQLDKNLRNYLSECLKNLG